MIFEILGESESSYWGRETLIPHIARKCVEDVHDNKNRKYCSFNQFVNIVFCGSVIITPSTFIFIGFIASSVRLLKKLIDIYPSKGHGVSSQSYDRLVRFMRIVEI